MKMPTLPKMPKLPKLPRLPKPQPKRLQATARRAAQPALEEYDDEPTTRLSSAFVVVLILHIVAVGGIYAFNSIKAHRRAEAVPPIAPAKTGDPAPSNSAAVEKTGTPSQPVVQPVALTNTNSGSTGTKLAPISGSRVYHVQRGDTLAKVASQHSVSQEDLQEANGIKANSDLKMGTTLNIPSASKSTQTGKANASVDPSKKLEGPGAKKAETAVKVAATPATPKATPATPKAAATPAAAASAAGAKTYTVKKGDNPVTIAKKFGVSSEELLKVNKIDDPKKLRIDQVLKIPAKKE